MYFSIFPSPRALELGGPSTKALFREEYMTKRREPKARQEIKVSMPIDATGVRLELLLGTQWFAFP